MSPLWRTFMNPGVQLMRRLRLPFKVGLIGLMLFVPMVALLVALFQQGLDDRRSTLSEHEGALVARQLLLTVAELQSTRDLNHRVLNGDTAATAPRDAARERLRQRLKEVDATLASHSQVLLDGSWLPVRQALDALA
jgi:hypothetical protein